MGYEGDEIFEEYRPIETPVVDRRYRRLNRSRLSRPPFAPKPGRGTEYSVPDDFKLEFPDYPRTGRFEGKYADRPTLMRSYGPPGRRIATNTIIAGCSSVGLSVVAGITFGQVTAAFALALVVATIALWAHFQRDYQRKLEMDEVVNDIRPYMAMRWGGHNYPVIRIRRWCSPWLLGAGPGTPSRVNIYHWEKIIVNPELFAPIAIEAFARQGWGEFRLRRYDEHLEKLIFVPVHGGLFRSQRAEVKPNSLPPMGARPSCVARGQRPRVANPVSPLHGRNRPSLLRTTSSSS